MQGFKLIFLGRTWTKGFEFNANPSLEIVRNVEKQEIYIKPGFDFRAYGDLATAIELEYVSSLCQDQPIEIWQYRENEYDTPDEILLYAGLVRISDINNAFNTTIGSYKEVEVIDDNLNRWFMTNQDIDIEVDNPWDLDCNYNVPPQRITIQMFDPSNPGDIGSDFNQRFVYRFVDILTYVIKIITRDNVQLISDFFTIGEGRRWTFATGEQIASRAGYNNLPVVSWKKLKQFMNRNYRLWAYHYLDGGQEYIRIEPYEYFFEDSNSYTWQAVSELNFEAKLDKLYSSVRLGEAGNLPGTYNFYDDEDFETAPYRASFTPYEYEDFERQQPSVGSLCGSGSELDLAITDISVDSNKIEFAFLHGRDNDNYSSALFVIYTNEAVTEAQRYFKGAIAYYNKTFINSFVIRRWFDGISPVTVYPEASPFINYFDVIQPDDRALVCIIPAAPTDSQCIRKFFEGTVIAFDPDNTITNFVGINDAIPAPLNPGAAAATQYTCTKPGVYKVQVTWTVSTFGGLNNIGADFFSYAVMQVRDNFNVLVAEYQSPGAQTASGAGQSFNPADIIWQPPSVTLSVGYKLRWFLRTNFVTNNVAGNINYGINSGSRVSVVECGTLNTNPQLGLKQSIYEIAYSGYPISQEDLEFLLINPAIKQYLSTFVCDEFREFDGYIKNLKYDFITQETEVTMLSGRFPPFDAPPDESVCWVLNECGNAYWRDECRWYDNRLWCDA